MSVSKGLLVTERDRRKQTTDRSRVVGEVVVRRDHKGDKGDFEGLVIDNMKEVLKKKPDQKLKWATKAFHLVAKGAIEVTVLYDILAHPKFASSLSKGIGRQARTLIDANIHVFSAKQQKFLQSDTCKWNSFESGAALEGDEFEKEEEVEAEEEDPDAIAARIAKYKEEAPSEIPNTNWVVKSKSETALEAAYTEALGSQVVSSMLKLTPWQKKKNEEGVKFNAFDSAEAPSKKFQKKGGIVPAVAANGADGTTTEKPSANPLQQDALWLPANAAAKAKDAKTAQQTQQVVISSVAARTDDTTKPGAEVASSEVAASESIADATDLQKKSGNDVSVSDAVTPGNKDKENEAKEEDKSIKDKEKDDTEKAVKEKKEKDDSSKTKKESNEKERKNKRESSKDRKDASEAKKDRKNTRESSKERKDTSKERKDTGKTSKDKKEKGDGKDRKDRDESGKERKGSGDSEKDRKDPGESGKSNKDSKESAKHRKDAGDSNKDHKDSGDSGKDRKEARDSSKDRKDSGDSGKDKKDTKDSKSGAKANKKHKSKSRSRDKDRSRARSRSRSKNAHKSSDRRKRDRSRSHRSRSYRSRSHRRRESRSRSRDRERRSRRSSKDKDFINQRVEKMVTR